MILRIDNLITRRIFQPLVDRLHIDPRTAPRRILVGAAVALIVGFGIVVHCFVMPLTLATAKLRSDLLVVLAQTVTMAILSRIIVGLPPELSRGSVVGAIPRFGSILVIILIGFCILLVRGDPTDPRIALTFAGWCIATIGCCGITAALHVHVCRRPPPPKRRAAIA